MAADCHCNSFGHARANQITHASAAEVVKQTSGALGGRIPEHAELAIMALRRVAGKSSRWMAFRNACIE